MKKTSFTYSKKGFTLIEIMVSVSIFIIVMVIAIGSVLSITNANRKAQALNSVISNLNFAVDSMVRDIRTGSNYSCLPSNCTASGNGTNTITVLASNGHTITYTFVPGSSNSKGSIQETDIDPNSASNGSAITITASDVDVKSLRFYVSGVGQDGQQPKVLLQMQGQAGVAANVLTTFNIQTLISQRLIDN